MATHPTTATPTRQRPRTLSRDLQDTPVRTRLNSREIPRTYSGLYEQSTYGCSAAVHTDNFTKWFGLYLLLILLLQFLILIIGYTFFVEKNEKWPGTSLTYTNVLHSMCTLWYIHWLKGSLEDPQGEMENLTIWEQWEATPNTSRLREGLFLVPTLLTYGACHFAKYEKHVVFINIVCWAVVIVAKLPFMNGVRIFGINRTVGIDDEVKKD